MKSTKLKELEKNLLKKIFGDKDNYLTSQYNPADLILEKENYVIIGEHKTRFLYSNDYLNEGFILENKKKNALFEKANLYDKNVNILYINYFAYDNVTVIWDLKDIFKKYNLKLNISKCNKTSASDFKYSKEKVDKDIFYLKLKDAKIIKNNIKL